MLSIALYQMVQQDLTYHPVWSMLNKGCLGFVRSVMCQNVRTRNLGKILLAGDLFWTHAPWFCCRRYVTGGGGGYRPHYPMQAKLQEITSADAWDRKLPPTLLFPLFAETLLLLLLFLRIHLRHALTMTSKTRSKLHFIYLSYAVNITCLRRYWNIK